MSSPSAPPTPPKDAITMKMAGWGIGVGAALFLIGSASGIGLLLLVGGVLFGVSLPALVMLWILNQ